MKDFIANHSYATAGSILLLLEDIEDRIELQEDFQTEVKVLKKLIEFSSSKTIEILETILKDYNFDVLKNINQFDERFIEEIIQFIFTNSIKKINFPKKAKLMLIDRKLEFNNLQAYFQTDLKNIILLNS